MDFFTPHLCCIPIQLYNGTLISIFLAKRCSTCQLKWESQRPLKVLSKSAVPIVSPKHYLKQLESINSRCARISLVFCFVKELLGSPHMSKPLHGINMSLNPYLDGFLGFTLGI